MSGYKTAVAVLLIDDSGRPIGFKQSDGDETFFPTFNDAGTQLVLPSGATAAIGGGAGVDADDVGFDIIGAFGQSNMEGNPVWDPLIDVGDPGRVFQWANSSADTASYRQIITGVDPLYMPNGIRTGKTGLATWAVKAYLGTIPANRRVLIVPVAVGSTAMVGSVWQPGSPGGTFYERAISDANLAITAAKLLYPNSRYVGTMWAQGEADGLTGTTQVQYFDALKALILGMRARITGAANSWFVISPLTPEGITGQAGEIPINLAHIQAATEIDKVARAAPISGYAAGVHWTAPGVRIMGTRLGLIIKAATTAVGTGSVVVTPPPADTLAPVLTSPTSASTGTSTGTGTVSTNEANGTLFGIVSTSSTATAPAVKAGASQAITTTGVKTFNATGLAPSTQYYIHFLQTDAAGNDSAVVTTAAFTTAASATAPAAPTIGTITAGDGSISVPFTPGSDGGSAITGHTATAYRVSDNVQVGQASGASSPIVVTTANDVAVYAKVKSTNAINTGAESAASNSVTPAAAGGGGTFTTLNPADAASGITLSGGNLTAAGTSGLKSVRGIAGKSTGKWYYEAKITVGTVAVIGSGQSDAVLTTFPGANSNGYGYYSLGAQYYANTNYSPQASYTTNDVIGVALDLDNYTIQYYKNNVAQGTAKTLQETTVAAWIPGTVMFPMIAPNASTIVANFGGTAFAYTPPTGFAGWTA
jgi:hypothetical protein